MENPATWGEAEHVVSGVLQAHFDAAYKENTLWGLSLERRITDALRQAGLRECAPRGSERAYAPWPGRRVTDEPGTGNR